MSVYFNALAHLFCFTLLLAVSAAGMARESIHFSCVQPTDSTTFQYLLPLYQEAFDGLDLNFSMTSAPALRDIAEANAGRTDGQCMRSYEYAELERLENLHRVEVAVWTTDFQMWGHSPDTNVSQSSTDALTGYRVGYRRGFATVREYLKQRKATVSDNPITTVSGLKMLAARRLDIYIDGESSIEDARRGLLLRRPIYLLGTIERVKSYPYLHKRHRHLAAPLAAQLKRILDRERTTKMSQDESQ